MNICMIIALYLLYKCIGIQIIVFMLSPII